jgi:oxygen-independent coproporphyrinogen-3 oxidase
MSRESHVLAEHNVPRYTSYPTAPHFTPDIGADLYGAWLDELPDGERLSLYLHVPFCTELCLYCGCHTKAVRRREPLDRYAENLVKEISLLAGRIGRRKVSHLHWGGGTPSILDSAKLIEITDHIGHTLDLSNRREHAIELDPRYVGRPLVRTLARMGVNRASLGVQCFSADVQQAIGRIQPYELVAKAIDMLREAGIVRINLDLMYGLPRQTTADIERNVALAADLKADRIALFGYAHVPWFRTQQRLIDAGALPGPAARLEQTEAARATLASLGYQPIGFDHFALPHDELAIAARTGALRRNFQGYTTDDANTLVGIGASAIGRLAQGFVQNAPDVAGYERAIRAGRFATVRGVALALADRVRGRVIERLMCDLKADLAMIAADCGSDEEFVAERAALAPLVAEGLVTVAGPRVAISDKGRPFVRLVASAFDAYLQQSRHRHSVAV